MQINKRLPLYRLRKYAMATGVAAVVIVSILTLCAVTLDDTERGTPVDLPTSITTFNSTRPSTRHPVRVAMPPSDQLLNRYCCQQLKDDELCTEHSYYSRGSSNLSKNQAVHTYYPDTNQCLPLPNYNTNNLILQEYDTCCSTADQRVHRGSGTEFPDAVAPGASANVRAFMNASLPLFENWLPWKLPELLVNKNKQEEFPSPSGAHDPNANDLYRLEYFCIDSDGRLVINEGDNGDNHSMPSPLGPFEGYHEHYMFPNMTAAQKLLSTDNIRVAGRSIGIDPIPPSEFARLGKENGKDTLGDPVLIFPLDAQSQENPGHMTHRYSTAAAIIKAMNVKGIIFVSEFGERAPDKMEVPTMTATAVTLETEDNPWEQHMCPIIAAYHMAKGTLHKPLAMVGFYQFLNLPHVTVNSFGGKSVWLRAGDDVNDRCGLEEDNIIVASKQIKEPSSVPFPREISNTVVVQAEVYAEMLRRLFAEASDIRAKPAESMLRSSWGNGQRYGVRLNSSSNDVTFYKVSSLSSGRDLIRHFRFRQRELLRIIAHEGRPPPPSRMCFRHGIILQVHYQEVLITNRRLALGMATAPNCHSKAVLAAATRSAIACACHAVENCAADHYLFSPLAAAALETKYVAAVNAYTSATLNSSSGHDEPLVKDYDALFMSVLAKHPVRMYAPWRTNSRRLLYFSEYLPILQAELGRYITFTFNEGLRKDRAAQMRDYLGTDIMFGVHGADMHGSAFMKNTSLLVEIALGPFDGVVPIQRGMFGLYAYSKDMGYLRFQAHTKGTGWPKTYPYLSLDSARELMSLSICTWLATNSVKQHKPFLLPFWCRAQRKTLPSEDRISGFPLPHPFQARGRFGFTLPSCPAFAIEGPYMASVMEASDPFTGAARIGYGQRELVSRCFSKLTGVTNNLPKESWLMRAVAWLVGLLSDQRPSPEDDAPQSSPNLDQVCVYPTLSPSHLRRIQSHCVFKGLQRIENATQSHKLLRGLKGLLEAFVGIGPEDATYIADEALFRRIPDQLDNPEEGEVAPTRNTGAALHGLLKSLLQEDDTVLSAVIDEVVERFIDVVAAPDAPDKAGEVNYPFYSYDPVRFDHCQDYLQ